MPRERKHSYFGEVIRALDQLGNALTGGAHDELISSRLGKQKLRHGGILPWGVWWGIAKPLDWVLEKLDPGHSVKSIELDEGDGPTPE